MERTSRICHGPVTYSNSYRARCMCALMCKTEGRVPVSSRGASSTHRQSAQRASMCAPNTPQQTVPMDIAERCPRGGCSMVWSGKAKSPATFGDVANARVTRTKSTPLRSNHATSRRLDKLRRPITPGSPAAREHRATSACERQDTITREASRYPRQPLLPHHEGSVRAETL